MSTATAEKNYKHGQCTYLGKKKTWKSEYSNRRHYYQEIARRRGKEDTLPCYRRDKTLLYL